MMKRLREQHQDCTETGGRVPYGLTDSFGRGGRVFQQSCGEPLADTQLTDEDDGSEWDRLMALKAPLRRQLG